MIFWLLNIVTVINKIHARLEMWKRMLLSMAGRVCLLKTVLSSLLLNYMSIFLMPNGIAQVISLI